MMPRVGYDLPPEEQDALVLNLVRPGWARLVEPGDILVTGRNFGTGSSRPAPTPFTDDRAVDAQSVGRLIGYSSAPGSGRRARRSRLSAGLPPTRHHAAELTAGTGHDRFDFTVGLLLDGLARRKCERK